MSDFRNFVNEQMQDPEFRKEYEATRSEYELLRTATLLDSLNDPERTIEKRIVSALGLSDYQYIMTKAKETDIATDRDFQRVFNRFYIVRRNEEWRSVFYEFFEDTKTNDRTFGDALTYLYDQTGNVEPSFTSKMLATLHPEMPIWDRYVIANLGFELAGKTKVEQIANATSIYQQIQAWYDGFLITDEARKCIEVFNRWFPSFQWLTPIKKVDFFLWSIR